MEFIAQLCGIKAFEPAQCYQEYLRSKSADNIKGLGDDMAKILKSNNGWDELFKVLNDLRQFELFKKNNSQSIFFDDKNLHIDFPQLKYKFDGNEVKLTLNLVPCISETIKTKLITRHEFSCPIEKFLISHKVVEAFFEDASSFVDKLFTEIAKFYIERIKKLIIEKEVDQNYKILKEFCNVRIYFIGSPKFAKWVKFSKDRNMEKMDWEKDSNSEIAIDHGQEILTKLTQPEEKYKWFSRSRVSKDVPTKVSGIYGICGNDNLRYCKVVGVIDDSSSQITDELASDLTSRIDVI